MVARSPPSRSLYPTAPTAADEATVATASRITSVTACGLGDHDHVRAVELGDRRAGAFGHRAGQVGAGGPDRRWRRPPRTAGPSKPACPWRRRTPRRRPAAASPPGRRPSGGRQVGGEDVMELRRIDDELDGQSPPFAVGYSCATRAVHQDRVLGRRRDLAEDLALRARRPRRRRARRRSTRVGGVCRSRRRRTSGRPGRPDPESGRER